MTAVGVHRRLCAAAGVRTLRARSEHAEIIRLFGALRRKAA